MGEKEQTSPPIEGIISFLTRPITGLIRYFFPPFECSIMFSDEDTHTLWIENTDKRNLYVKSLHPFRGLLKRKFSLRVEKKLLSGQNWKSEIHYPYSEMEWCIVTVKRFVPIPQIKEVKELKKKEFWVV